MVKLAVIAPLLVAASASAQEVLTDRWEGTWTARAPVVIQHVSGGPVLTGDYFRLVLVLDPRSTSAPDDRLYGSLTVGRVRPVVLPVVLKIDRESEHDEAALEIRVPSNLWGFVRPPSSVVGRVRFVMANPDLLIGKDMNPGALDQPVLFRREK